MKSSGVPGLYLSSYSGPVHDGVIRRYPPAAAVEHNERCNGSIWEGPASESVGAARRSRRFVTDPARDRGFGGLPEREQGNGSAASLRRDFVPVPMERPPLTSDPLVSAPHIAESVRLLSSGIPVSIASKKAPRRRAAHVLDRTEARLAAGSGPGAGSDGFRCATGAKALPISTGPECSQERAIHLTCPRGRFTWTGSHPTLSKSMAVRSVVQGRAARTVVERRRGATQRP